MSQKFDEILKELEKKMSESDQNEGFRFALDMLSPIPFVGGVFSGFSGSWSASEQENINTLITSLSKLNNDRITRLEKSIVEKQNPNHIIMGFIKFNPNNAEIIDSSVASSITEHGQLDFTINFIHPQKRYFFNFYGSSNISVNKIEETQDSLRIIFDDPCPDTVTIVFYEAS